METDKVCLLRHRHLTVACQSGESMVFQCKHAWVLTTSAEVCEEHEHSKIVFKRTALPSALGLQEAFLGCAVCKICSACRAAQVHAPISGKIHQVPVVVDEKVVDAARLP